VRGGTSTGSVSERLSAVRVRERRERGQNWKPGKFRSVTEVELQILKRLIFRYGGSN
jgi:hypothetical protein